MRKYEKWEVDVDRPRPQPRPQSRPQPRPQLRTYPYSTVVPLKLSRGVRWSDKMHIADTRSGEFLRSEARYKSNVERVRNECMPYVIESREIIRHINNLELNNQRAIDELEQIRASSSLKSEKETLRDMVTLELLENNEKIMRYKDRLNELKTIQESIYRMHEVHLQASDRIKDATDVHFIRPYVQYLGHRGTRGGRNHKTKKPRTRKNTHRH
jgi:hypothetical protein